MKRQPKKRKEILYVVKKYVKACSVEEALQKERRSPVDSVWIDDDWANGKGRALADAIGFASVSDDEEA